MSLDLYYFSATGNSLLVCKEIQQKSNNCTLNSIAKLSDKSIINPPGGTIGIIFPLYFSGMPKIVKTFIKKLDFSKVDYIFAIATKSQYSSPGLIPEQINDILKEHKKKIDSVFYLSMTGNFIKKYDILEQKDQISANSMMFKKIKTIMEIVNKKEQVIENPFPLLKFIGKRVHEKWIKDFHMNDNEFNSTNCNLCGLCERICPKNNISLSNNKPEWNHDCELCFACVHVCPLKGIQYGKVTIDRKRYINPSITVDELLLR